MTQYTQIRQLTPATEEIPFTCWHPTHKKLFVCYSNNLIEVFLRECPESCTEIPVTDITAIYEYDPCSEFIFHGKRHNHIVGEYSRRAHSVIIFHKKRKYEIPLPPRVLKIECGGRKIFLS